MKRKEYNRLKKSFIEAQGKPLVILPSAVGLSVLQKTEIREATERLLRNIFTEVEPTASKTNQELISEHVAAVVAIIEGENNGVE